jgi:hypothetical protein
MIGKIQGHVAYNYGLEDWDPLVELAKIAANPREDQDVKIRCLTEILPYWYPKRKAIEVDLNTSGPVGVLRVPTTTEDWAAAAAQHREAMARLPELLEGEVVADNE